MTSPDRDGGRLRAVFYFRVGSGVSSDQDYAVARQAVRIAEMAERLNLAVAGIFTDFAVTRSTPWSVRPAARRLSQRLADRAVLADVVVVEDAQHSIGPDNIPAALTSLSIPLCTPREALRPVTEDDPLTAITGWMSMPTRPLRRARPFPVADRRR